MNISNKITKSKLALAIGALLVIGVASCIEDPENEVSGKGTSRFRLSTSDFDWLLLARFLKKRKHTSRFIAMQFLRLT
jgi:hypothetical protein